jgi:hypothetical protein
MAFELDHPEFASLTEAFTYILGQYALQESAHVLDQSAAGVIYRREVPRYLFRGECGQYETTMDSARRLQTEVLEGRCHLSNADVVELGKLIYKLAGRLCQKPYSLDRSAALALLQHYRMPTRIIDFTGHLGIAFAFAASGNAPVGRVAVLPYESCQSVRLLELSAHPWASRAQRQAAYGVLSTNEMPDLKAPVAGSRLNIRWYQFPIVSSDRDYFKKIYEDLLREEDDPSAGFLRFHITEYVEAFGKLSPALTDWLLQHVLVAPHCYLVESFEGADVVVNYQGSNALPGFSKTAEAEHSRKYWSRTSAERSFDRMRGFVWPAPGSIVADPRTYHGPAAGI